MYEIITFADSEYLSCVATSSSEYVNIFFIPLINSSALFIPADIGSRRHSITTSPHTKLMYFLADSFPGANLIASCETTIMTIKVFR
jgi:hypothetical protein